MHRLSLGHIRREENALWSFVPHDISMILALIGAMPVRVVAEGAHFLSTGVADTTGSHFSFPGGEQAHIFVLWLHAVAWLTPDYIARKGIACDRIQA